MVCLKALNTHPYVVLKVMVFVLNRAVPRAVTLMSVWRDRKTLEFVESVKGLFFESPANYFENVLGTRCKYAVVKDQKWRFVKSGFNAQRSQRSFGQRRFGGGNSTRGNNNRNSGDISQVVVSMIDSISKFMKRKDAGFNFRSITPKPCGLRLHLCTYLLGLQRRGQESFFL